MIFICRFLFFLSFFFYDVRWYRWSAVPATIEHQHPSPEDDNNRSNSGGNHNNNSIAGSADDEEENELITSSTEEDEGVHLLKEGADLDLSCQAKGKPPPVIVWKYQV